MPASTPLPFMARLGLRIGLVGSSASLALALGTAVDAAARIGFYSDTTGAAEKVGMVVGGQTGPIYTRNGSVVDVVMNGALTAATLKATGLTSGCIPVVSTGGLIVNYAGLILVGTPSATAPSTGTNGPGLNNGVALQVADGANGGITASTYGNSVAQIVNFIGYACQGTAASPGATIATDQVGFSLRGHDGTNFTGTKADVRCLADGTWTPSSMPTTIQFRTTQSGATTLTAAGRVDAFQSLIWGANVSGVGTYSGGTFRPHIQTISNSSSAAAGAGIAQSCWSANSTGPTAILAKSRGSTAGPTQGVVTAGDTAGTLSWQLDDGANFIEAARVRVVQQGTVALTRMGGKLFIDTGTDAAPTVMTAAFSIDNVQQVAHLSTVDSTSITTGGAIFSGGVGIAKRLCLDGATGKTLRITNINANAAVAVTLGSTGCTGTTAGAPQGWMRIDINGTDRFMPFW